MSALAKDDPAAIVPFQIRISDAQVADLKERLTMTRWPHATTSGWSHGQAVPFVKALAERWLKDYDWRKHEAGLNRHPHFLTEIDGQRIHFVHVKSKTPGAFPLILTHGWPSTFYEYFPVIEALTNPPEGQPAFDVVIPSIPGYGFSSPLAQPGWDSARVARAWDTLMKRLGYARYGAQGGDVGALISKELGILKPDGLAGIHLQQIFAFPKGEPGEMDKLDQFEMEGFANLDRFQKYAAYNDIHQKRPGTLGYGLVDSPVALLAWNAELFFGFEGEGAPHVDRDAYLTHVSIYWFTGTGASSAMIYFEDAQTGAGYREVRNETPTGVSVFPWDFRSVRSFAERSNTIVHWTQMPRGGHFAASDVPDLLVEDLRRFFGTVR
jgi:pimeloyl-ACP methyl ester carboxylesterase